MHYKLKKELQVVGTLGNSFPPPGKILGINLYFTLDTTDTSSSIPQLHLSGISHLSSLFPPLSSRLNSSHFSLHLWSCPFYSILKFAAIIAFLKYKHNNITPQMHILRWFPSVFYIKSDILVGHLRPFTFGLCLFSVHFFLLSHDGRHFPLLLTKL